MYLLLIIWFITISLSSLLELYQPRAPPGEWEIRIFFWEKVKVLRTFSYLVAFSHPNIGHLRTFWEVKSYKNIKMLIETEHLPLKLLSSNHYIMETWWWISLICNQNSLVYYIRLQKWKDWQLECLESDQFLFILGDVLFRYLSV